TESEANKYKIYEAICEVLPRCRSLEELENHLLPHGIQVQYKYKGQTTEKQGIGFKIGNDCFKGSKVDRKFSLANLQKTLDMQAKQTLQQPQQPDHFGKKVIPEPQPLIPKKRKLLSDGEMDSSDSLDRARKIYYAMQGMLDTLLSPEEKQYDDIGEFERQV